MGQQIEWAFVETSAEAMEDRTKFNAATGRGRPKVQAMKPRMPKLKRSSYTAEERIAQGRIHRCMRQARRCEHVANRARLIVAAAANNTRQE